MREERTIAGRSLAAFRRDPNFTGAFVGGPPLLTAEEVQRLVDDREAIAEEAAALVERLRNQLQSTRETPERRQEAATSSARSAG